MKSGWFDEEHEHFVGLHFTLFQHLKTVISGMTLLKTELIISGTRV